ncbi:MAG: alpha/beta hydrolase-fold protein [Bacteroidota bacterium]
MKVVSLLIGLLSICCALPAQEVISIGHKQSLASNILQEEREIWVYTPPEYESGDTKFPVMYLLDGDGNFHHTTGLMNFLQRENRMPPMIVIAVLNTNRTRDLTPKASGGDAIRFPDGGGADQFLAFMADELFPFVEKTYRTQPYRLLVGHSFGGLFAAHTILNRPELFNAYIAISPSLWWDNQEQAKRSDAFFKDHQDLKGHFFMTMGNEGGDMLGGAWRFAASLEEHAGEHLKWDFVVMETETHGSIPHRSTYQGLEFIFKDWFIEDPARMLEEGGLLAFQDHYRKLSAQMGYEVKVPEQMTNQAGYHFLRKNEFDKAIDAFAQNVKDYPSSANVHDSAGDGYFAKGDYQKAKKHYAKAVDLAKKQMDDRLEAYEKNLEKVKQKLKNK